MFDISGRFIVVFEYSWCYLVPVAELLEPPTNKRLLTLLQKRYRWPHAADSCEAVARLRAPLGRSLHSRPVRSAKRLHSINCDRGPFFSSFRRAALRDSAITGAAAAPGQHTILRTSLHSLSLTLTSYLPADSRVELLPHRFFGQFYCCSVWSRLLDADLTARKNWWWTPRMFTVA